MNGKIMMGFGVAVGVWGAVALIGYQKVAEGVVLIVAGIALLLVGNRQSKWGH
jgi:hypothetical protein